jgi:hypothetical protein
LRRGNLFIGISPLYSFKSLKGCDGKEYGGVGSLSLEWAYGFSGEEEERLAGERICAPTVS